MSPPAAESYLRALLNRPLHIYTTDNRMFVGEFKCTDKVIPTFLSILHLSTPTPSLPLSSPLVPAPFSPIPLSYPSSSPSPSIPPHCPLPPSSLYCSHSPIPTHPPSNFSNQSPLGPQHHPRLHARIPAPPSALRSRFPLPDHFLRTIILRPNSPTSAGEDHKTNDTSLRRLNRRARRSCRED